MSDFKTWGEMTSDEKGALLLADHEGRDIEGFDLKSWSWCLVNPEWDEDGIYRVKTAPKIETVTLHGWGTLQQWLRDGDLTVVSDSHGKYAITFNTIDGEPDCTSIRMKKLI